MKRAVFTAIVLTTALGCGHVAPPTSRVMLVESVPIETSLGFDFTPDAYDVWPFLIANAANSIDWATFYVSDEEGSRLEPTLLALEEAVARGVRVRLIADAGFYDTYPEYLDRLDTAGVFVRLVAFDDGGAMHAKYFLIDDASAFVGSQNTDWRALEHIYELGIWTDDVDAVATLSAAFVDDWDLAVDVGEPVSGGFVAPDAPPATLTFPTGWSTWAVPGDRVVATISPEARRPADSRWDLDEIRRALASAESTIDLSLLSFSTGRDDAWTELYDGLRDAGARGVRVRIILADWGKRESSLGTIQALQREPGVTVRFISIPQASDGFIPYARVSHAKYLVVDDHDLWLGTSNWSRNYFYAGRNLGLVIDDEVTARAVGRSFDAMWSSEYAETVDPDRTYEAPRVR